MVALPRTVYAYSDTSILTRLRIVGAVVVVQDGQISIRNASRVPPALMAEARARRDDLIAELAPGIAIPCARCGTPSPPFVAIINPDHWQCNRCLPADPIDQAIEAIERVAIIGEAKGDARAAIPHPMPASWADPRIKPTPGARCSCCRSASWWCEATNPKGWRCSTCYPADHLDPAAVRVVTT